MNDTFNHLLFVIDAQYDFCHQKGALYVQGAQADMERLAIFIEKNGSHLDHIIATLDTHHIHDIAHPDFWEDAQGNPPAPFTPISAAEVEAGKWKPRFEPEKTLRYLQDLEAQGEFPHFIWTRHCIVGTKGAALEDTFATALQKWAKEQRKNFQTVEKGLYPFSEHFGVFQAQIPDPEVPYTQTNFALLQTLAQYQTIWIAGQAKSHCVATSLKQILDFAPHLAERLVVLEDCMSDVAGLGHLGKPIYERAKKMGVRFAKATELVL
ncbi:nicotinamidase [Hugenholtzia roseola]|uniref:nicotinamidase n=1 Tax=Hugenholtzia roseola TaxID=1002 RepID=UPI00040913CD|nr:nicotinamidase [Hugenholtzia roseola]